MSKIKSVIVDKGTHVSSSVWNTGCAHHENLAWVENEEQHQKDFYVQWHWGLYYYSKTCIFYPTAC